MSDWDNEIILGCSAGAPLAVEVWYVISLNQGVGLEENMRSFMIFIFLPLTLTNGEDGDFLCIAKFGPQNAHCNDNPMIVSPHWDNLFRAPQKTSQHGSSKMIDGESR